jgi:transcriptional regulator with XRE-family HTH domain
MNRIYELRISRKWTQTELAEAAGLSQNAISDYEGEKRQAGSTAIAAMARALECSSDYLLGLTDDPTPMYSPPGLNEHEAAVVAALRSDDRLGAIRLIVLGE